MAEEETEKDERTLDPTPRRKKEFRDQGKVALSRDLAGAIQLGATIVAFLFVGNGLLTGLAASVRWVFSHVGDGGGQRLDFGDAMAYAIDAILVPTIALSAIVIVATLAAYFSQTGLLVNLSLAAPKFSRISPLSQLAEIFSPRKAFIKIGLTTLKLGLSGLAITLTLAAAMPRITTLTLGTLESTITTLSDTLVDLLVVTLVLLAVVAVIDYIYQRRQLASQMRMTPTEMKKEMEEDEGRPEFKQRRRARHRELSMNRILREVPTADVILTNPTHFAVALRYRAGKDKAPVVVAKGADELAAVIRKIARQNAIPIIEHRSLARALYNAVKVGRAIPADFFQQVAEILARVYRGRRDAGRNGRRA
jgi:flagellar biosynthetic protein FlhB